ncbi:MAG: DUF2093 domain-containing protein [Alphaproteobacteria bacterium]|nr:DUF2093 domain-containing protein [Alphaproteobacteria bacterium]
MNFIDPSLPPQREAKLKYLDGDFQIIREGEFVRCAVSGAPIRLDDLRYWSVDKQIAYRSAAESYADRFK